MNTANNNIMVATNRLSLCLLLRSTLYCPYLFVNIKCNTVFYHEKQSFNNKSQRPTANSVCKQQNSHSGEHTPSIQTIGLYRENAIAIQKESGDSNGGKV